jgi:signal peptide peptidase SppA
MLQIIGHPWCVTPEVVIAARRLLDDPSESLAGFGRLRAIVELHAHQPEPKAAAPGGPRRGGNVAVIPVLGLLTQRGDSIDSQRTTSVAAIADTIRSYATDQSVDAIVLEFDSPGGSTYGIAEAAAVIREARAIKPVVASANSIAGSGAYWLASQADEVIVTPSGLVGSIGVYVAHVDESKAADAAGKRVEYVSAGKYKLEGNPHGPLSDEARGYAQAVIDKIYGMFTQDVARGRGVGVDAVREGFGQGRMVLAKQAVEQGMANSVGTIDDAIRRAASLAGARRKAAASVAQAQAMMFRRGRS